MTRPSSAPDPQPDPEPEDGVVERGNGELRTLRVRGQTRSVHVDDVDEVIGLAAELKEQAADRLTVTDLEDIGRELDIEPAYIRKAMDALMARQQEEQRQQEENEREEARRTAKWRRRRNQVLVVVGSLALALLAVVYAKQGSLRAAKARVDEKAAQVDNVIERQAAVKARYESAPAGPERDAMLDGAENRVRIERKRYDEAAAAYNAEAGGPLAGLATGLFGLPANVPLSNEVERW